MSFRLRPFQKKRAPAALVCSKRPSRGNYILSLYLGYDDLENFDKHNVVCDGPLVCNIVSDLRSVEVPYGEF